MMVFRLCRHDDREIHSPASFIQCDYSDFEAEKNVNRSLKCFRQIENLICRCVMCQ